jgi:hypothetical protein
MKMPIDRVSSYAYIIAPKGDIATHFLNLEKSPWDLVIAGNSITSKIQVHSDKYPLKDKLIIGYIDIGASTGVVTQDYLNIKSVNDLPSWFGKSEPGYDRPNPLNNLYTVQFWQPQWLEVIKRQIDDHIKYGYDGIFLDEITSDAFWYPSNRLGNSPFLDAEKEMYELLGDIFLYVASLKSSGVLNKPFYLIANNPERLILKYPNVVKYYDLAFRESIFWIQEWEDGAKSIPDPSAASSLSYFDRIYLDQKILINDYPPLDVPSDIVPILQSYMERGWIASLQRPLQSYDVMYSGPFVFQPYTKSQTIVGSDYGTNYFLGGVYDDVKMIGSNFKDNYFLFGSSNQSALGGERSDFFYMHPKSRYEYGEIVIKLASTIKAGMSVPNVSILINDKVALQPTPITAANGSSSQDFRFLASDFAPLSSIKFIVAGTSYKDPLTFSNVSIKTLAINGINADLSLASFSNGGYANGNPYSNSGTVTVGSNSISSAFSSVSTLRSSVSGGIGYDTAIYEASSAFFTLVPLSNGLFSVKSERFLISDLLSDIEVLSFSNKTIRIDARAHGSYADLPDTLYQFFVVGFGAAPGVTYMDQMAEAYRYWLPQYKDATVKQIVEAFTTKSQFTSVYPQALYRTEGGKYYAYAHDASLAGKPLVRGAEVSKAVFDTQMASLAQGLVATIVKTSASDATKGAAAADIQAALGLGGDWTIGKVIYTVFGNLASKPLSDPTWGGTAKQFANQVAVAKYYTDTLSQSTDDVTTLRSVMAAVTNTTDVSSTDAIASLIGVALLNGPGI